MLGLARGVRRLDNIRVDFLVDQMPPRLQWLCAWGRFAAVGFFAFVMVFYGTRMALANWTNMNTGFEISMAWIYLAVPVSGVLILLFTFELIFKGERGFF
jgi:TRAP-type C4-dicarboxylate transport system permease small subunit